MHNKTICNNCVLLRKPGPFSEMTVNEMANSRKIRAYKKGHCLLSQGGNPDAYFCIASGKVSAVHFDSRGSARLLMHLHPQESFPSIITLDNLPLPAAFLAKTPVSLCQFPAALIQRLLEEDREFHRFHLRAFANRFRRLTERTIGLLGSNAGQLVAAAIYHLRSGALVSGATRQELSEWTNLAPETVSRTLSQLEKRKLISRGETGIRIQNLAQFQAFLGQ